MPYISKIETNLGKYGQHAALKRYLGLSQNTGAVYEWIAYGWPYNRPVPARHIAKMELLFK